MKQKLLLFLVVSPLIGFSQGVNITSWSINTTGHQAQYYNSSGTVLDLNDSSEVQEVCYNDDTIYVRANMLASFIMGDWPGDPFLADGQNNAYLFPRNPTYPSSTHQTKPTGLCGLQINGVALYDDEDGKSYNSSTGTNNNTGAGVWDQIAWVAHADEMDAGNAHPDPNNIYHNHHNPIQLCSVTDDSQHSPIIGWAFDGWPIYGPFGYSSAMDNTSAIARMTPSWYLRSITTRTTFYDGSTASQTGPVVSTSFPLGTYVQDYGYTAGLGDLDYYNGRYCVTPEFPSGTYAYFLNTDASGNAQYPNMIGPKYYGSVYLANFGSTSGQADELVDGVTCYVPSSGITVSLSSSTNVTCNGLSNGSATVSASGGSGSYTYSWSPSGGSAATATGLSAGTYTVTVSDGSNTGTLSVTITQPTAISISTSVTNPTCSSSTNGSVNATVSGGTTYDSANPGLVISEVHADPAGTDSPFEFVELLATKDIDFTTTPYTVIFANNGLATSDGWIEGLGVTYAFEISTGSVTQGSVVYVGGSSMTPTTNVLRSINTGTTGGDGSIGNSSASGVLGNGGTSADAVAVFSTGASNVTSSTVPVDAIFFGTATGSAVVSAGSAGYQLPVNDKYAGGKLQTTSSLAATSVSGQYLKATGSYNLQTDTWTTARTWANTATFTNLATSVTLSSPYSYSWSSGPTTEDISSIGGGSYTITVTDAIGCTNTATATVTAPSAVTGSTSITNVNCFGNSTGAVDLTPTGGNGIYTYSWTGGATTQDISSKAAGTYTVTITDGNSCTGTVSATITQPSSALSQSGTTTSTGCSTSVGAVNVTTSGGTSPYTYSWSNGATTEDISSLAAGTYTLTITDSKGCTSVASYTISSSTGPSLSTTASNVTCNGSSNGSINLTVTGGTSGYTYSWSNSATTQDISSIAAGTYTVTVTDAASCTATTSVTITQPTALSAGSSSTTILCNGGTSTVTITASGGTSSYTGTGTFTQSAGTTTYTITDANGCTASTNVTVTQPSALSASSSSTAILCNGGTSTVSVSASGGTSSYTGTGTFTQSAGTTTYTVTDANGCTATTSVTVTQPTALSATSSSTSILCNGGTSTVTIGATGGTSSYTGTGSFTQSAGTTIYTVTDANGCTASTSVLVTEPTALSATSSSTAILCNGGTSTVTITASGGTSSYTGTGSFTQSAGTNTYTVTDANGCTATTSATVTEPTALSMNATPSTTSVSCNGDVASITVSASGGTPAYSGTGTFSQTAGTTTYSVTDANGCTTSSSITITEPSAINATVSSTTILCNGDDATITVSATGGTGTLTGTGTFTESAGTYSYTITDDNGCSATESITITEPAVLSSSQSVSICQGDSYTIGTSTYTISGTYTDILSSVDGCDSTVTTILTVSSIDNTVTTASATATAVQTGATYQWIDCNNSNLPISGATAQSYTATNNGSYAVIITLGSCIDTSTCVTITGIGVSQLSNLESKISIYPNPASNQVTFECDNVITAYLISDLNGKTVIEGQTNSSKVVLNTAQLPNGVYTVKVSTNKDSLQIQRLVISK